MRLHENATCHCRCFGSGNGAAKVGGLDHLKAVDAADPNQESLIIDDTTTMICRIEAGLYGCPTTEKKKY